MSARDYLAAVQQRADAATNGPWTAVRIYHRPESRYADDHWCWQVGPQGDPGDDDDESFVDCIREDELDASDLAELIAASRTDVPCLVAALTAVLDLADRWERGATRWADPLPVPPEVEQLRAAITEHLTSKETDS